MKKLEPATSYLSEEKKQRIITTIVNQGLATVAEVKAIIEDEQRHHYKTYMNDKYVVQVRDAPENPLIWLSIRRLDRAPVRDWRHRIPAWCCGGS